MNLDVSSTKKRWAENAIISGIIVTVITIVGTFMITILLGDRDDIKSSVSDIQIRMLKIEREDRDRKDAQTQQLQELRSTVMLLQQTLNSLPTARTQATVEELKAEVQVLTSRVNIIQERQDTVRSSIVVLQQKVDNNADKLDSIRDQLVKLANSR